MIGIFEAVPIMACQSLFFLQLIGQDRAQSTDLDFLKIVEEHFVLQAKQLVFASFCSRLASNPSLKAVCC